MTAGKAANILRILSAPGMRDDRFVQSVTARVSRGKERV